MVIRTDVSSSMIETIRTLEQRFAGLTSAGLEHGLAIRFQAHARIAEAPGGGSKSCARTTPMWVRRAAGFRC
jgi:hypothetical protein